MGGEGRHDIMSPHVISHSQPKQAALPDRQGTCAPEWVGWAAHSPYSSAFVAASLT